MNTYQTRSRTSQEDKYALKKGECYITQGYKKS